MNWIKLRDDLKDDPSVLQMANLLKMDVWAVIGRLADVWAWVGRHTASGENVRMDDAMIDLRVRRTGFAAAMRKVLWLAGRKGALCFPNWERHNANSCKARLLGAEDRKGRGRNATATTTVEATSSDRTKAGVRRGRRSKSARSRKKKTTEKKIREEKRTHVCAAAVVAASDALAADAAAHDGQSGAGGRGDGSAAPVLVLSSEETPRSSLRARGALAEMIAFCQSLGLGAQDAEYCFHKWEGSGWKNSGRKIACWRSTIRAWMSAGYLPVRRPSPEASRAARGNGSHGSGYRAGGKMPSRTYEMTGKGPVSWDPMSGDAPPPRTVVQAVQASLALPTVLTMPKPTAFVAKPASVPSVVVPMWPGQSVSERSVEPRLTMEGFSS